MQEKMYMDKLIGCGLTVGNGEATFEYAGYQMFSLSIGVVWEMMRAGDAIENVLVPLLTLAMYRINVEVLSIKDEPVEKQIEWFVSNLDKIE